MGYGDELLAKYNPYHDAQGRFTFPDSANWASIRNKDAVGREKAKYEAKEPHKSSLPKLEGTEKQVAYANDIRDKAHRLMEQEVKNWGMPADSAREFVAIPKTAKFWIDSKQAVDYRNPELIQDAVRTHYPNEFKALGEKYSA